jgi:hypothetical protein
VQKNLGVRGLQPTNHVVVPNCHAKLRLALLHQRTIRANMSSHVHVASVVCLKRDASRRHFVLTDTEERTFVLANLVLSRRRGRHITDAAEETLVKSATVL